MSERIKAGEAYVLVSRDNTELKKGLQEVSQEIDAPAREISTKEKNLTPKIRSDPEPVKKALDDAMEHARKATQNGAGFFNRMVVTAGDAARAISVALNFINDAIGKTGDMFDKASKRVGASSATLSEYAYAAQMSGASFSDVEGAFIKFSKVVANATEGATEANAALTMVGLCDFVDVSAVISFRFRRPPFSEIDTFFPSRTNRSFEVFDDAILECA